MTWEDVEDTAVPVWPDNLPAVNAFVAMDRQWNHGFSGPTGLKYESLPFVFRMVGIPRAEWSDTFECVRVMEAEAMRVMQEKK